MIKFRCNQCDGKISVPDSYATKRVLCSRCGAVNVVPQASTVLPKGFWEDKGVDLEPKDELTQLATLGQLRSEGIISEKEFRLLKERVYLSAHNKGSEVIVVPDAADSLITDRSTMAGILKPDESDVIDESTMAGFEDHEEPPLHDGEDHPAHKPRERDRQQSREDRRVIPQRKFSRGSDGSGTSETEKKKNQRKRSSKSRRSSRSRGGSRSGSRSGSQSASSEITMEDLASLSGSHSATGFGSASGSGMGSASGSGFGSGLRASAGASGSYAGSGEFIMIGGEEGEEDRLPAKYLGIAGAAIAAIIVIGLVVLILFFRAQSQQRTIDRLNDTVTHAERRLSSGDVEAARTALLEVIEASVGRDYLGDVRVRARTVMGRVNAVEERERLERLAAQREAIREAERRRAAERRRERLRERLEQTWPDRRQRLVEAGGRVEYDAESDESRMILPMPPIRYSLAHMGAQAGLEAMVSESFRHYLVYPFGGQTMDEPPVIIYLVLETDLVEMTRSIREEAKVEFDLGDKAVFAGLVPIRTEPISDESDVVTLYFGLTKDDLKLLAGADQPAIRESEVLRGRLRPEHTAALTLFADVLGLNLNADTPPPPSDEAAEADAEERPGEDG